MDCEYSDGINPTRTELLEEKLSRLQERLEDLEGRAIGQGTQPESEPIHTHIYVYYVR